MFNRAGVIGPYLGEAIAAFTLVFAGCGAIIANTRTHGQVGSLGIAFSFGLAVAVMVYAVGHVSGAHINPAVTFGFALTRHFPLSRVPLYWLSQLVGATGAALLLRALFGDVSHLGTSLPSGSDGQSFVMETVLTFLLMFVIMAVATDNRAVGQAAALAIGGTILLDAIFGGPVSGASMNPARSIAPQIVGGDFNVIWIYAVGPLVGAALAAAVGLVLFGRPGRGERKAAHGK